MPCYKTRLPDVVTHENTYTTQWK